VKTLRLASALTLVIPKGSTSVSRKEARVFTSIWKDGDFTALPQGPQWLYLFLLSQDDLSYCGVLALRPGRWVRKQKGLTVAAILADLAVLAEGDKPFVVVDDETGEVLLRSLIRHDGIWKMPNIMKAARDAAASVESPAIRAALLAELERIPAAESTSKLVRDVHAAFLGDLNGSSGNPSPNPSVMGNEDYAEEPGYPQDGPRRAASEDETAAPTSPQAREPRKGSGNPSPNPSQGIGGYSPLPLAPIPEPHPPAPREPARLGALLPGYAASAQGEEISDERTPRAVAALIAEVLAIRDDWDRDGIRRVLDNPKFTRRPWLRGAAAMIAVARDPETDGPGRVLADGPWWRAPAPVAAKPPHCGKCDKKTRMRETDDGLHAARCPDCHPQAERRRTA
jgi:hypothetical protein